MKAALRMLGIHLWKDAREQRHGIVMLALSWPALIGVLVWLVREDARSLRVADFLVTTFPLAALLTIGGDLVAGETQRRTVGLLERLPAGLGTALVAKAVLLIASLAAFWMLGFGTVALVATLRHEGTMVPTSWLLFRWSLLPLAGASLWMLAVTSWVERAGIAVLIAGGAVAILGAGIHLGGLRGSMDEQAWANAGWLALAAAAPAAWLSFVVGRRFGGGCSRSAQWGGGCAVLVLAPFVLPAAHKVIAPIDPYARDFRIAGALIGSDPRCAFINVSIHRSYFPCIVDLQSGALRRAGPREEAFVTPRDVQGGVGCGGVPGRHVLVLRTGDAQRWEVLDGGGASIGADETRVREEQRDSSPIRMPDGRRVWFMNRRPEVEVSGGGCRELPWRDGDVPHTLAGFGIRLFDTAARGKSIYRIYDVVHEKRYERTFTGFDEVHVLPQGWLLSRPRWMLLDPETGSEAAARGLEVDEDVAAVLDDGRVLVTRRCRAEPWVFAVDVGSGARSAVRFAGGFERRQLRSAGLLEGAIAAPCRTPLGARLFMVQSGSGYALVRLDLPTLTFTPPLRCHELLDCDDEDTVLVISQDQRRIERAHLTSGAREIVFPR